MVMPDVNILVYAHRRDAVEHERYAAWVEQMARGPAPFAISELAVHGFLRIVTHPRIFRPPSTINEALEFIDSLLASPGCDLIRPGPNHWSIFRQLCQRGGVKGKMVADAVHAALAIESGCEWVTADTDFARFAPPLRWQHL
jgi:uncharacterized protein